MPKLQTGSYSLSQIFITCQRVIRSMDNQLFIYDKNEVFLLLATDSGIPCRFSWY